MEKIVYVLLIVFLLSAESVVWAKADVSHTVSRDRTGNEELKDSLNKGKTGSSSGFIPLSIGFGAIMYLFNPVLIFENNKIGGGITKEFSAGFGYFGEHRFAFDYSYIFRAERSSFMRLSYKYDMLLKDNIKPSNMLQGTSVISIGGGYFTDFHGNGFFPEISYGYSLRNHKLLIYPHFKLRYTIMTTSKKSNLIDFSFGITLGIANPFINLKIRNPH